jgi:endonuclease/exonuclease/phosphatase family metal-dependent hydrolase
MQEEHTVVIEKAPKNKRAWLRRIFIWLNWSAIISLLLACLAPYVSPDVFWPLAFFGLLHPVFVVANLFFLALWVFQKRKMAFWSLAVLLISIPFFGLQIRIGLGETRPAPDGAMTVISYNVKLFDLYNWTGNKSTRQNMFEQIGSEKPDLLCVQEFYNQDSGEFRNLDTLRKLLNLPYAHVEYTMSLRHNDHWGVVTYSRFPIVNTGKIVFNNRNNNICIYTDIVKGKDTLRIYNMHLQSVNFGYADYKFLNQLTSEEDAESEIENSKHILRRMKRAYAKRSRQAESIKQSILLSPYPVIVCGDFNDTPVSYAYHTIKSGLADAYCESGRGFGKTFDNPSPFPRIDYILHSQSLQSWQFHTRNEQAFSDHYPVICRIDFKK